MITLCYNQIGEVTYVDLCGMMQRRVSFFFSVNDIIVRNRSKRVYDHRFCENSPDVNTFASLLIYCITTVRFVWVFVSPLHFLWTHFLMSCENAFEFPLKYLPFANLCKNMVSFAVALTVYWKHESHCCMTHDCTRSAQLRNIFIAETYFSQRLFYLCFQRRILWNTQISQPVIYDCYHTFPKLEHVSQRSLCVSVSASTTQYILRTQLTLYCYLIAFNKQYVVLLHTTLYFNHTTHYLKQRITPLDQCKCRRDRSTERIIYFCNPIKF